MNTTAYTVTAFVLIILQGLAIFLKTFGFCSWSWLWILSPVLLGWSIILIIFLVLCRKIWKEKYGVKRQSIN